MANQITYEYLFTMIDKISPAITKMSGQIDKMEHAFVRSQEKMQESTKKTISKMDMFIQKTKQMGDNMRSLGAKGLFASIPTGLFAKSAYREFASYDTLLLQMRTTFGDTADAMIKEGNRIADSTALGPQQAFQLLSKIKQTGSLNNQEIVKVTNDLINTTYGVGASKQFDRIAWQFSQVLTKGEVELEDIKTIAEAGLPIFTMLGNTLKKTPQQLLDIISEKGVIGISSQDVVDMLDKYGKIHKNAQVNFAKSAEGKLQILSETYTKFSRKFGQLMEEAGYGDMIVGLTKFFNFLSEKIDNMSPNAKKFTFYFTLLAIALPPILITLGLISSLIGIMAAGMALLLSPFVAIPILIVAAGVVMYKFRKQIWDIWKIIGEFVYKWSGLGFVIENVTKPILNWIGDKIQWLSDMLTSFISKFEGLTNIASKIGDFFTGGQSLETTLQLPQSKINNSLPQASPWQRLMQTQTVNNNTTTNSQIGIDLNVNGIPKGSEVKTKASNVPNGMNVATNYNLGF